MPEWLGETAQAVRSSSSLSKYQQCKSYIKLTYLHKNFLSFLWCMLPLPLANAAPGAPSANKAIIDS